MFGLKSWFDNRYIKVPWHRIKNVIKNCSNCPNFRLKMVHNYKGNIGSSRYFNYRVQIDFIGTLAKFKNAYVCTMTDTLTGLALARPGPKPDSNTCIMTILQWCAQYGTPAIIESDQGTHFTSRQTQKVASALGILWDFHKAYNPIAEGAIECFNGLLKKSLKQYQNETLPKEIWRSLIDLNNRRRANRKSPLQDAG